LLNARTAVDCNNTLPQSHGKSVVHLQEGTHIEAALDYLDMKRYADDPDFQLAWREFARACNHLLVDPPHEAKAWIAAADEYDAGRLSVDELTVVREQMSNTFAALFDAATIEERAALSAAGHRLWPRLDADGWHETAWYFLNWCATAGIEEIVLVELLRQSFGAFLTARGTSLIEMAQEAKPNAKMDGSLDG
jgi:hypothetical protein